MTKRKADKRRKRVPTRQTPNSRGAYKKYTNDNLKKAFLLIMRGQSVREVAPKVNIPRATLGDEYKKYNESGVIDIDQFLKQNKNITPCTSNR